MSTPTATLIHSDCLTALRALPDNSVDLVLTDPPYGLGNTSPAQVTEALTAWLAGDREYLPSGRGFMGKEWDAFVPPVAVWDEALRVLKPGGHVLAFAGSRTQDLMGLAIRLAGFEIRDSVAWVYATGFPKSMDVSKAIDKQRDDRADILAVTSWLAAQRDAAGLANRDIDKAFGTAGMAGHWTSTKSQPAVPKWDQWGQLRGLIGFGTEMDAEVWRLNGRKGAPGEAWEQREVIGTKTAGMGSGDTFGMLQSEGNNANAAKVIDITAPATDEAKQWAGWGTALKPAHEPIIMARKPLEGTVAANVLAHGTGALNIDASRIGTTDNLNGGAYAATSNDTGVASSYAMKRSIGDYVQPAGRFPANVILDESQAAVLDAQSGITKSPKAYEGQGYQGGSMFGAGGVNHAGEFGDSGGASRFFYVAKAPKSERPVVDGIAHPTVKPLALMRYLAKLACPPGGVILDPFAGSGTTVEAALLEGFDVIGIEREADYIPLIESRIARVQGTDVLETAA